MTDDRQYDRADHDDRDTPDGSRGMVERVTVRMGDHLIADIDAQVENGPWANRSEMIREACHTFVADQQSDGAEEATVRSAVTDGGTDAASKYVNPTASGYITTLRVHSGSDIRVGSIDALDWTPGDVVYVYDLGDRLWLVDEAQPDREVQARRRVADSARVPTVPINPSDCADLFDGDASADADVEGGAGADATGDIRVYHAAGDRDGLEIVAQTTDPRLLDHADGAGAADEAGGEARGD